MISMKPKNYLSNVKQIYAENANRYILLEKILAMNPKHLKILGGEPLLDQKMLKILESYKGKSKTNLLFTTNGSVSLTEISERLGGFNEVNYSISLDGIGPVQDYIRKGSNWESIDCNIKNYKKQYPNNQLSVGCVVQCLNIFHLDSLMDYCSENEIALNFMNLEDPYYLGLETVPPTLKDLCVKKLENKNFKRTEYYNQFDYETIDLIKVLNNTQYKPSNIKHLKLYIDWYDPEQKWNLILPEWKEYLG